MPVTENHGYNVPEQGSYDDQWHIPLNENFRMLDVDVVLRGLDSQKPGAGQEGRIYNAIDTNVVYHDTGTEWDAIAGHDLQGNDLRDSQHGTLIYNGTTGQLSQDLIDDSVMAKGGTTTGGDLDFESQYGVANLANANFDPVSSEPAHDAGNVVLADGTNWDPDGDGSAELVISTGSHWKELIDFGVSL